MADHLDGFPSLETPLVLPGAVGRVSPAWYRFFVTIWKRSQLVGEMRLYAGATVPAGTLQCNGQAVSRGTYAALFLVIGIVYGAGDGVTTFNLPNLASPTGHGMYAINF